MKLLPTYGIEIIKDENGIGMVQITQGEEASIWLSPAEAQVTAQELIRLAKTFGVPE